MKKILLYTALATFTLAGCNQEDIKTYELDDSRIYFQEQNFTESNGTAGYSTSMEFSYEGYGPSLTNVVFSGSVKIMGEIKNYDRSFTVVVDEENTTMVEGEGYEINFDTLCVKAGENSSKVSVRFLRPKRLQSQEDTLTIKLVPNEHFDVLESYKSSNNWQNTTAKEIDGQRYQFRISEIYTYPGAWSSYAGTYLGTWTVTKYIYINELFGFTKDDWTFHNGTGCKITQVRMPFYAKELQKDLQAKADAGNPVMDENNQYMQLPSPYSVNYENVGQ